MMPFKVVLVDVGLRREQQFAGRRSLVQGSASATVDLVGLRALFVRCCLRNILQQGGSPSKAYVLVPIFLTVLHSYYA